MLNIKNLLQQILSTLTLKTGVTMTGEVKTNTGAVAIGSGQIGSSGLTISEFVNQVRYSSGAMGSVNITSSSAGGVTFSGWYNYCYIPHRSGGLNGAASGDNHNYGNIILTQMTVNSGMCYNIRVSGGSIAQVHILDTAYYNNRYRGQTLTSITTTNYSLETAQTRTNYSYIGRLVILTLGVTPVSPVQWSSAFASGLPIPLQPPVYGALCCHDGHSAMAVSINASGQISGSGGVANKTYYGTIYYISAS